MDRHGSWLRTLISRRVSRLRLRSGHLEHGWSAFFSESNIEPTRPVLRTFGHSAEKFREAFKNPHLPERAHKAFAPGPGESSTWGIGGTHVSAKKHIEPRASESLAESHKRHLTCATNPCTRTQAAHRVAFGATCSSTKMTTDSTCPMPAAPLCHSRVQRPCFKHHMSSFFRTRTKELLC